MGGIKAVGVLGGWDWARLRQKRDFKDQHWAGSSSSSLWRVEQEEVEKSLSEGETELKKTPMGVKTEHDRVQMKAKLCQKSTLLKTKPWLQPCGLAPALQKWFRCFIEEGITFCLRVCERARSVKTKIVLKWDQCSRLKRVQVEMLKSRRQIQVNSENSSRETSNPAAPLLVSRSFLQPSSLISWLSVFSQVEPMFARQLVYYAGQTNGHYLRGYELPTQGTLPVEEYPRSLQHMQEWRRLPTRLKQDRRSFFSDLCCFSPLKMPSQTRRDGEVTVGQIPVSLQQTHEL